VADTEESCISAARRAVIWPIHHVASVPAIMGIHGTIASVPWILMQTVVSPECALMHADVSMSRCYLTRPLSPDRNWSFDRGRDHMSASGYSVCRCQAVVVLERASLMGVAVQLCHGQFLRFSCSRVAFHHAPRASGVAT
jgi:hypothetical protein